MSWSSQQLMDPLGNPGLEFTAHAAPSGPPPEVLAEMARADVRRAELAWGGLHIAFHAGAADARPRVELETVDGELLGELSLTEAIAMACDEDAAGEV
jgi:hypothetical protein